jgi:hypothetical protein
LKLEGGSFRIAFSRPMTAQTRVLFLLIVNLFHNARKLGKGPEKLVISVMGEKGKPFTAHKKESH